MSSLYLPIVDPIKLEDALNAEHSDELFRVLVEPLHEELFRRKDFNFLDDLSEGQQLILSFDYLREQVGQGGFIQLLVNGYVGLLPPMPQWLLITQAQEMSALIDEVLQLYVPHHEKFREDLTPEEFARLYNELKGFEPLDERFQLLLEKTTQLMMNYARHHLEEFISRENTP